MTAAIVSIGTAAWICVGIIGALGVAVVWEFIDREWKR